MSAFKLQEIKMLSARSPLSTKNDQSVNSRMSNMSLDKENTVRTEAASELPGSGSVETFQAQGGVGPRSNMADISRRFRRTDSAVKWPALSVCVGVLNGVTEH